VDGEILKEMPLTKERCVIGRRPTNDLVIDHVAISGEHAAIVAQEHDFLLEDLNSTNGTQVNGQPIKKHLLQDCDVIILAPYRIQFFVERASDSAAPIGGSAKGVERQDEPMAGLRNPGRDTASQQISHIRVMTGQSEGKEIPLTKPLTTIGRPGVQVAVISRRKQGYFITHVEGAAFPLVNGISIEADTRLLKVDDVIDLSGTKMIFERGGV
jgi:hypothetical protein